MRIKLAMKIIQVLRDLNIVSLRSCSPYRKTGPGLNFLRKKHGLRRLSLPPEGDCPSSLDSRFFTNYNK